jgi:hypothetical protein
MVRQNKPFAKVRGPPCLGLGEAGLASRLQVGIGLVAEVVLVGADHPDVVRRGERLGLDVRSVRPECSVVQQEQGCDDGRATAAGGCACDR